MALEGERPGTRNGQLYLNRGPNCWCCRAEKVRVVRRSPRPDGTDPDYAIRVCPTCDLTPAPSVTWPQGQPPSAT